MELDHAIIAKLTKLSRIACSEEEQVALQHDLLRILDYLEQLKEVSTDGVPHCDRILSETANVMRDDAVGEPLSREDFLANAPNHVAGFILVPDFKD